jgi:hypothetical protein
MIPNTAVTVAGAMSLRRAIRGPLRFPTLAAHYVERIFQAIGHPFDVRLCLRGASRALLHSTAADVERLVFDRDGDGPDENCVELSVTRDGPIDGFLLWLRIEMPSGAALDTLDERTSWFPTYVPAFAAPIDVRLGDVIDLGCRTVLSPDGVHPDYILRGAVRRQGAEVVPFEYALPYMSAEFRRHAIYAELFDASGKPAAASGLTEADVRRSLKAQLPDYMLPSRIRFLERLPLTPNGKIDRTALLAVGDTRREERDEYIAPQTETQRRLAMLWEETLDVHPVGIRDDFFELGGHSIAAIRLVNRVRDELGRELAVGSLYREKTIEGISRHL